MKVIVCVEKWNGTVGVLEDRIPGTDWFNVRVRSDLRLALCQGEFVLA